jgi:hypothetical protein
MNDDDRQEGIFDAPAKHAEPPAKVCGCGYPPHVGRCQPNTGTESEESTITSLAVIETTSASLVYAPGALTALVDKLKQEVRAQLATLDVSIPSQRARIISLSARVASAKVKLDKLGDSLIEEHRAVVTAVNADRKVMRDDMDAFKVEVRKPVTDLENAEKERVAAHEAIIHQIEELGRLDRPLNLEEIADRAGQVSILADRDWQEFKQRAVGAKVMAMEILSEAQDRAVEARRLREQAERLESEARERAIKEREEAAAKAAKEAAERRAEERAWIARQAAIQEQQRIENDRIEAEARAKQAEAERIAAEERAARELKEAEERAEEERFRAEERAKIALAEAEARERRIAESAESARSAVIERARIEAEHAETRRINEAKQAKARRIAEAEAAELAQPRALKAAEIERIAAVAKERLRLEDEQREARIAAETRAENKAHRLKIDNEVLGAIVALDIPMDRAQDLLIAIAKGAVPHVTIEY